MVTTGRLAPEKRLPYLIQVFMGLKKIKPDVRFVIVGDGPELKKLIILCNEANLQISEGYYTGNRQMLFLPAINKMYLNTLMELPYI